ncbi:Protein of unknown function [Gryllus bimaculatus]|nr:Protein of unknown function [Gryllus bimaculatus]
MILERESVPLGGEGVIVEIENEPYHGLFEQQNSATLWDPKRTPIYDFCLLLGFVVHPHC